MRAGHVFTIEPMINEGSWQDMLWPDDWTAVAVDGKRSAQFEHTLLVTDNGCDILTKYLDQIDLFLNTYMSDRFRMTNKLNIFYSNDNLPGLVSAAGLIVIGAVS